MKSIGVSTSVKRSLHGKPQLKKKKQKLNALARVEGSYDELIVADVRDLLNEMQLADAPMQSYANNAIEKEALPAPFTEAEVRITSLSSTGDGLGYITDCPPQICVVPFTVPGDVVLAKIVSHNHDSQYTVADLVRILQPSPQRDDELIKCPYFAVCSGCQHQMLPYSLQLEQKKKIVEKAYRNFAGLPAKSVPSVRATVGSPLEYGYRTKLTPHFDGPPGHRRAGRKGERAKFDSVPPIGFMRKGTGKTLDIEVCPIATESVQIGLRRERKRVASNIGQYQRGATLLLRESTERIVKKTDELKLKSHEEDEVVYEDLGPHVHAKRCVTDNNATTTEFVDDYVFQNRANAFFQNNNSILSNFTAYIRECILGPSPTLLSSPVPANPTRKITNLIDAYCGSGLFTIILSPLFSRSIGIDISTESIAFARKNAELNNISGVPSSLDDSTESHKPSHSEDEKVTFIAADATTLFFDVPATFLPAETAIVIDPPRKGCDESFLHQLINFRPARIVYVSCNVHTQARDVGWILRGGKAVPGASGGLVDDIAIKDVGRNDMEEQHDEREILDGDYEIESLQGFDFFPQTAHVEAVAVLRRKSTSAP